MWSNNKLNNALATIKALYSYKHAEHFNKRVIAKAKREDSDEKEQASNPTPTVVKEIQAKQSAPEQAPADVSVKTEKKAVAAKPAAKKPAKK